MARKRVIKKKEAMKAAIEKAQLTEEKKAAEKAQLTEEKKTQSAEEKVAEKVSDTAKEIKATAKTAARTADDDECEIPGNGELEILPAATAQPDQPPQVAAATDPAAASCYTFQTDPAFLPASLPMRTTECRSH